MGAWICGRRMERWDFVMLVNLILVLGPVTRASAQTTCSRGYYDVGGTGQPWTIPSNPNFYQTWASSIQFLPGDCIWFNRVTNGYVYQVSAQDYTSCNVGSPLAYFFGYGSYGLPLGPFPVTQTYPQSYIFVEADTASCMAGMKFYVTVVDPLSVPSPPPSTSVNASTTPPPPMPPISPPGPITPTPTPPLVGEPTPTKASATTSKFSAGAIAGVVIAGIASALGVTGAFVKISRMDNVHICSCITNNIHGGEDDPVKTDKKNVQKPVTNLDP